MQVGTLTRRNMVSGGIAAALACFLPHEMLAEIAKATLAPLSSAEPSSAHLSANLYAFAGGPTNTSVIAVTWPINSPEFQSLSRQASELRIHIGGSTRLIAIPANMANPVQRTEHHNRIFSGQVRTHASPSASLSATFLNAVAIETPNDAETIAGPLEIWAEHLTRKGLRHRIGSPFLSALVAENKSLAELYHSTSPADDVLKLHATMAEAIAARVRTNPQVSDPHAYGLRLASALLPDVLRFDPRLATGFTFAAQNGRHPADTAEAVVHSILNASPTVMPLSATLPIQQKFPYFFPITAAV